MRYLLLIAILGLAACTEATASRVDSRTFRIDGPGLPGGSDAPNRRIATRLCPNGYRVIDRVERRNTPDGWSEAPGVFTDWTIRCL